MNEDRQQDIVTRLRLSVPDEEMLHEAADEIERLWAANAELREALEGFLDCPEIADCAPEDKDPETDALERKARAALARKP